jgi:hypothetical protein
MSPKSKSANGGLKGFFSRASKSFMSGGLYSKEKSTWLAEKLCRIGFILATTSIVLLMPLVFEIAREGQVSLFDLMYCCL